jgi:hypothetical protein
MKNPSMYELTHKELAKYYVFNKQLPPIAEKVVKAIPYTTVPDRMKATIAINEIMTFASQFRRNIVLWDETSVPINTISFVLTGSGGGKDSSVRAARKCFKPGYELIVKRRHEVNKKMAIKRAQDDGQALAEEYEVYKPYLKTEPPIFMSPTSGPGFIQHINDLGEHQFGAGLMYSGEFGDELAYNQDMTECIKVLSETYDLGEKEVKYTKAVEFRSKEISGQPVSALMVGSPTYILYDEGVKKKFNIAFMSKLARRSWFCYTPEQLPEPIYTSIDDMIQKEEEIEVFARNAREELNATILDITDYNIGKAGKPITVPEEVFKLFKTYKRYNNELADSMANQHSTSVLVRRHLQWKALKLAGALAIVDKSDTVKAHHYVEAIRFAELMSEDMGYFEHELNKADYERFADFIKTIVDNSGHATMTAHDIKKMGFIKVISKGTLYHLITAAASYDHNGIYTVNPEATEVRYEAIIKTDVVGISFKPIDNTQLDKAIKAGESKDKIDTIKSRIASTSNYGLDVADTTFVELGDLLSKDYAYSPFKFKNGTRSRDGIIGGTKWVVLDIDDSQITAEETHLMLEDINHHIALSSDPNNHFKFRVLIELDSVVDVSPQVWKHFFLGIADYIALVADPLPQSQIFFSYSGRQMWSVTDAEPLEVRDFLMRAHEKALEKPLANTVLTNNQKKAMIDDELTTFNRAFDADIGDGSRSMIWAARKAFFDLGMSHEDTKALIYRINDYWHHSMDPERLERTIIGQINRF